MKLENVTPPTPDEMKNASGMSKIAAQNWKNYCRACRTRFNAIKSILEQEFGDDLSGKQVLDWGCAAGGVSILMDDEISVSLTAADVDEHSLSWLSKTCNDINCMQLTPGKALPFENQTFDAVYGISVLTHIPPNLQEFYLSELQRITCKRGVVVITVNSYGTCDYNREQGREPETHPNDREQLKRQGIIYTSYPDNILNKMDFSKQGASAYGTTYHSGEYIHEIFGQHFNIDEIRERGLGGQDVIILHPK